MQPINRDTYDSLLADIATIESKPEWVMKEHYNNIQKVKDELLTYGVKAQIYPATSVLIRAYAQSIKKVEHEVTSKSASFRRSNASKRTLTKGR